MKTKLILLLAAALIALAGCNDPASASATFFTVAFDANGATSGDVPSTVRQVSGTTMTMPGNTGSLVRGSYTFGGWNTSADGSGESYVEGAEFTFSADMTLYAQWGKVNILFQSAVQTGGKSGSNDSTGLTLTFDADPANLTADYITLTGAAKGELTGSGVTRSLAISDITVANGETVSVTVASPEGYSISGSPRTAVVYTGLVVTFDDNYEGGGTSRETVVSGNSIERPDAPGRSGYCFYHWYTDEECTTEYDFDSAVTADMTLYACWIGTDDSRLPSIKTLTDDPDYGDIAYVEAGNITGSSYIVPATYDNYPVKAIYDDAFSSGLNTTNSNLTSIEICYGVELIGDYAFCGCEALESVEIPESVTEMGKYAFGQSGLTSAPLVPGMDYDDYCFAECEGITSVEIPDSVTSLGRSMFSSCANIKSVTIGAGLTTLPNNVFGGIGITSIEIPDNITTLGSSAFSRCQSLTDIDFGSELEELGRQAFYGCSALKTITLPYGISSIGMMCFAQCTKLESITLPESVTTIGDKIFYSSGVLTSVTCLAETPPSLGANTFYKGSTTYTIYVPSDSVDDYKAADNWSDLADSIQSITE